MTDPVPPPPPRPPKPSRQFEPLKPSAPAPGTEDMPVPDDERRDNEDSAP